MERLKNLHNMATDHLDVLDGNPKPGWFPNIFSNDLGGDMLALGVDCDGGNAFCERYGNAAFVDADEFDEASAAKGSNLEALCSGILSKWRYRSQAIYSVPGDGEYAWFRATLGQLEKITRESE